MTALKDPVIVSGLGVRALTLTGSDDMVKPDPPEQSRLDLFDAVLVTMMLLLALWYPLRQGSSSMIVGGAVAGTTDRWFSLSWAGGVVAGVIIGSGVRCLLRDRGAGASTR